MTADEAKKIFLAIAAANNHPDPHAYAAKAMKAFAKPPAQVKGKQTEEPETEGE